MYGWVKTFLLVCKCLRGRFCFTLCATVHGLPRKLVVVAQKQFHNCAICALALMICVFKISAFKHLLSFPTWESFSDAQKSQLFKFLPKSLTQSEKITTIRWELIAQFFKVFENMMFLLSSDLHIIYQTFTFWRQSHSIFISLLLCIFWKPYWWNMQQISKRFLFWWSKIFSKLPKKSNYN